MAQGLAFGRDGALAEDSETAAPVFELVGMVVKHTEGVCSRADRLLIGFGKDFHRSRQGTEMYAFGSGFEFWTIPHVTVSSDMSSPNQSDKESHSDVSPEAEAIESKQQCVSASRRPLSA